MQRLKSKQKAMKNMSEDLTTDGLWEWKEKVSLAIDKPEDENDQNHGIKL